MINNGQWREFDQDTGVTPLLFTGSAMGFLMTTESLERESQDLGLTSHPKDILRYTNIISTTDIDMLFYVKSLLYCYKDLINLHNKPSKFHLTFVHKNINIYTKFYI